MSSNKPYVAAGKAPEKKNFTQACNLLNQYLKEKGSLRDLNINGKLDSIGRTETSTIDFLSSMENPTPASVVRTSTPPPEKSLPPLPEYIDVETYVAGKASSSSKTAIAEAKTAAMTIFYGGQVMVFNDFSEEKAREIMLLANKSTTGGDRIDRGKAPLTSPSNSVPVFQSNTVEEKQHQGINVEGNGSDLPIARRASLHKFLAKRKDRATARAAPYQVTTSSSSQKDEPNFDLNL